LQEQNDKDIKNGHSSDEFVNEVNKTSEQGDDLVKSTNIQVLIGQNDTQTGDNREFSLSRLQDNFYEIGPLTSSIFAYFLLSG
jgi:hypothetical protein